MLEGMSACAWPSGAWPVLGYYVLIFSSDAASGWAGWALALGVQLTYNNQGGQIMPTALLLAHPDLKT